MTIEYKQFIRSYWHPNNLDCRGQDSLRPVLLPSYTGSGGQRAPGCRLAKGQSSSNGSGTVIHSPSFNPSFSNALKISSSLGDFLGIGVNSFHVSFSALKSTRRTRMHWEIRTEQRVGSHLRPGNLYNLLLREREWAGWLYISMVVLLCRMLFNPLTVPKI